MGLLRMLGLGLFGILFVIGLTTANIAVAADRTVLNDDFVTDTAEEADLYALIAEEIREEALSGTQQDEPLEGLPITGVDFETLVNEAITEEWVRSQLEPVIENVYAFLLGDRDSLTVTIDTAELQDDAAAAVVEEGELDLGALGGDEVEQLDRMTESPEQFANERDQFRDEQKAAIQEQTDAELSEDELADALDTQLEEERETLRADFVAAAPADVPGLEESLEALADAWVDAMLGEIEYDEFSATVETATDDLTEAFVEGFFEEAAPFPESIEFSDEDLTAEERAELETVQDAMSTLTLVPFLLVLIVLGLAGAIVVLASPSIAAIGLGALTALIGTGTAGVAAVLRSQLPTLLPEVPAAVQSLVVTMVSAVFDVVIVQSVLLAVLGAGVIALGVAIRRDLLFADDENAAPAATETDADETAQMTAEETAAQDSSAAGEAADDPTAVESAADDQSTTGAAPSPDEAVSDDDRQSDTDDQQSDDDHPSDDDRQSDTDDQQSDDDHPSNDETDPDTAAGQ